MFKVNLLGGVCPEINMEFFKFPGGEIHFKRENEFDHQYGSIDIITDLHNSDEIMKMMLVADFFEKSDIYLDLLYLPYARQDRKTSKSEPFSLKTITKMINSCNFKEVTLNDPHSDVSPALIDRCAVRKRVEMFDIDKDHHKDLILVSPDAGAMKTNHDVAAHYGWQHICATKIRDVKTGQITETQVHTDVDLKGRTLLILDDICDGGRTFIELAKVLRTYEPAFINLHITVGIFSNGMDELNKHLDIITYSHKLGE